MTALSSSYANWLTEGEIYKYFQGIGQTEAIVFIMLFIAVYILIHEFIMPKLNSNSTPSISLLLAFVTIFSFFLIFRAAGFFAFNALAWTAEIIVLSAVGALVWNFSKEAWKNKNMIKVLLISGVGLFAISLWHNALHLANTNGIFGPNTFYVADSSSLLFNIVQFRLDPSTFFVSDTIALVLFIIGALLTVLLTGNWGAQRVKERHGINEKEVEKTQKEFSDLKERLKVQTDQFYKMKQDPQGNTNYKKDVVNNLFSTLQDIYSIYDEGKINKRIFQGKKGFEQEIAKVKALIYGLIQSLETERESSMNQNQIREFSNELKKLFDFIDAEFINLKSVSNDIKFSSIIETQVTEAKKLYATLRREEDEAKGIVIPISKEEFDTIIDSVITRFVAQKKDTKARYRVVNSQYRAGINSFKPIVQTVITGINAMNKRLVPKLKSDKSGFEDPEWKFDIISKEEFEELVMSTLLIFSENLRLIGGPDPDLSRFFKKAYAQCMGKPYPLSPSEQLGLHSEIAGKFKPSSP